jgi:hypothetical protein
MLSVSGNYKLVGVLAAVSNIFSFLVIKFNSHNMKRQKIMHTESLRDLTYGPH